MLRKIRFAGWSEDRADKVYGIAYNVLWSVAWVIILACVALSGCQPAGPDVPETSQQETTTEASVEKNTEETYGKPEDPYRQYENIGWYLGEERPKEKPPEGWRLIDSLEVFCEKYEIPHVADQREKQELLADRFQVNWETLQVGSGQPRFTDQCRTWFADLDHDGTPEKLVFDWGYMADGYPGTFVILNQEGMVVYYAEAGTSHVGENTYYLCRWEGKEYLMRNTAYEINGSTHYDYGLWELTSDGTMVVVDHAGGELAYGDGEYLREWYPKYVMDISALVEYAEESNRYMENAYLLFSTEPNRPWENVSNNESGLFMWGSPQEPNRVWIDYGEYFDTFEQKISGISQIEDMAQQMLTWCQAEGVSYRYDE